MITDADREAAAKTAVLVEMRELILAGQADHYVDPWAAHRLLGQREGLEMAAGVADEIAGLSDKAKNIGLQAGAMASASRIRAIEVG